jgi:putative bacteriocin precursor
MKKFLGKKPQMSKQTIETYGNKACICSPICSCGGSIPNAAVYNGLLDNIVYFDSQ